MGAISPAEIAVLIGRFQPFHNGHAALLNTALDIAARVVVVLGSSFHARNAKNPFIWQERAMMIADSLTEEDKRRVSFVPVRDYYDVSRWARAVRKEVECIAADPKSITLIGYFKDASSDYLRHFPTWQLFTASCAGDIHATRIRSLLFESKDIHASPGNLAGLTPPAVREYLEAWRLLPCYAALAQEHATLAACKASWSAAPYPPIFCTVDAVVRAAGHVLLIRRGGFPGKGLWAIPGGFLEQRERLLQGAIRELCEETKLAVVIPSLIGAWVEVKVFDHPDRSLRGRTITHAHFFDLKTEQLPAVEGADDAEQAKWVPIEQLISMEDQFFDDHFHILDQFLRLTDVEN